MSLENMIHFYIFIHYLTHIFFILFICIIFYIKRFNLKCDNNADDDH